MSSISRVNAKSVYNENLKLYLNSLKEGKNVTFPKLAKTLETISVSGLNGSTLLQKINSQFKMYERSE